MRRCTGIPDSSSLIPLVSLGTSVPVHRNGFELVENGISAASKSNIGSNAMPSTLFVLCSALAAVSPAFGASGDISLLTFNAGFFSPAPPQLLTHNVRRAALVNSIANDQVWRGTDVACLQEVRRLDDFNTISDALRQAGFTHQHNLLNLFPAPVPGQAACNDSAALAAFLACTNGPRTAVCRTPTVQSSFGLSGSCYMLTCQAEVQTLTQACIECFLDFQQPGVEDPTRTSMRCSSVDSAPDSMYRPTLGILLASRRPMTDLEAVLYQGNTTVYLKNGYVKGNVRRNVCVCVCVCVSVRVGENEGVGLNEEMDLLVDH